MIFFLRIIALHSPFVVRPPRVSEQMDQGKQKCKIRLSDSEKFIMKKSIRVLFWMLLVLGVVCRPGYASPVWIQVRDTMVRAKPAFYSPGIAPLRYGDQVEKISQDQGWVKVRSNKGEGFIPASAISTDRIVLSAREVTTIKADSADVVLAGKGFSKEVEQEYKKQATGARFDLVDRVERSSRVTHQEVRGFIKQGELRE